MDELNRKHDGMSEVDMEVTTETTQERPKLPYQTPELRDLGSVAAVTQAGGGTVIFSDTDTYHS